MTQFFTPNIIDVEASGFGAASYPIEVGVINQFGEKFCKLVKPQTDWQHWDDKAENLHGISRTLLLEKGLPIVQICRELNQFLFNQIVYSDGWVVDQPWMIKLFADARVSMQFKLSPLEMILDEDQMAVWHDTKDKVCKKMKIQRHRASSDAALIQSTFVATKEICSLR
ncbi:3'-5' exonuclease [Paraglaciecola sp.]|uniref:3'-5' exonuclease n=1 Tax=Paraglaciecola sp. TaxID=1920173 RepID=UPI003EF8698D